MVDRLEEVTRNEGSQLPWLMGWTSKSGDRFQFFIQMHSLYLNGSRIEEKLEQCQAGRDLKFKMHGDSAYFDDEYLVTGGGGGMSSVRESVEWGYKDLKTIWKVCDWRNVLKLRNQPVAKIMFVCFLLKNIYTTFYACQTAVHFFLQSPTFEDYIAQGPKAHPIPNDIIFSNEYNGRY
jgi:hypothetical protein